MVNAGDGSHEHPTQTLCDLYNLYVERGGIEGLNVVLSGDLRYSRTIHSFVFALARFGANIVCVPQPGFELPEYVVKRLRDEFAVEPVRADTSRLGDLAKESDAVYLTPQKPHQLSLFTDAKGLEVGRVDALYMTRPQTERYGEDEDASNYQQLGLEEMSAEEILGVLEIASRFRAVFDRPVRSVPIMRGRTVVNFFHEPSTRTRISFELAEKRHSADIINFAAAQSSFSKGETLRDTAENLAAMKIDMLIVRHSSAGAARYLAKVLKCSVINAGDGAHEHPTQGLLDIMTMRQRLGDMRGKKVTIIGDITHSRVARSNLWGLTKLGA